MRIRLRSRKINNSCYDSEAQIAYHNPPLPSASAYIYKDIHVKRCTFGLLKCKHYFRGWFQHQTCLQASSKAEYPSKPAHAGGIRDAEVKSSPQCQDSFGSWKHWAVGPRWCRMKSWTMAKVGAAVSASSFRCSGISQIYYFSFMMMPLNRMQQSSEAICVCRFSSSSSSQN